jgi:hypothetical protein
MYRGVADGFDWWPRMAQAVHIPTGAVAASLPSISHLLTFSSSSPFSLSHLTLDATKHQR